MWSRPVKNIGLLWASQKILTDSPRGILLLAMMFSGATPALSANLYAETYASANGINELLSATSASAPLTLVHNYALPGGSIDTYAMTDYGINRTMTSSFNNGTTNDYFTGGTKSVWNDLLTVTTVGNVSGFLIVTLDLVADMIVIPDQYGLSQASFSYSLQTHSASYGANISYSANPRNPALYINSSGALHEVVRDSGTTLSRLATISIPFSSGNAFGVLSTSICGSFSHPSGAPASGTCSADNSVYWGGVVGVTDRQGSLIQGWTLASDSGTDYTLSFVPSASVPEPSSWAMMIAGFGLVGGMLRRRKQTAISQA